MSDFAKLKIWDDAAIGGALSWYLDVAQERHVHAAGLEVVHDLARPRIIGCKPSSTIALVAQGRARTRRVAQG
jgi:hypothetical protein